MTEGLAPIPEGWFGMGSDDGPDDERPAHRVWVDAFELAVYPVTCDQYDPNKLRFCDQTGKTFQEYGKTSTPPFRNDFKIAGAYPLAHHLLVQPVHRPAATRGLSG